MVWYGYEYGTRWKTGKLRDWLMLTSLTAVDRREEGYLVAHAVMLSISFRIPGGGNASFHRPASKATDHSVFYGGDT